MKKLLLLMVGVIVAFTTQAQLYVCGDDSSLGNGTPANAKVVTLQNGYYTFQVPQNKWFKMSMSNDGKWDDSDNCFNAKLIYGKDDWSETNGVKSCTASSSWIDGWASQYQFDDEYTWIRVNANLDKIERCKTSDFGETTTSVTYSLHSQLTGNSKWATVDLTENNGNWEYTGDLVAGEFGIKKFVGTTETWLGGGVTVSAANTAYSFDGNTNSSSSLVGKYTIVYNPTDNTILFKSESSTVDPSSYTIYFYDQNNLSYSNVYAYVWNGSENNSWPGAAMTSTGKYVNINGNYYPVWYYNFSSTWTPTNVIINGGDDKSKITSGDPVFVNGGFYTNGSTTADGTTYELVNKPTDPTDKPTALYMHFKYDLEKGTAGADTQPYCHVYNTETKEAKGTWGSDAEKMTKITATEEYNVDVTDKYSIWKFDLADGDATKYNAVIFYFPYGDNYMRYSSVDLFAGGSDTDYGDVTENDQDNWTKYIYATYSKDAEGQKEFALQTYMTFEEFKARDLADIANGGRRNIHLIGWNGIQYFEEEGNSPTGDAKAFPSDLSDDLLTIENDHGCFYLPIKSTDTDSRFKISWINPKDYAPASPDGSRLWTTFDLGLVGVNKNFTAGGWSPTYSSESNGKVWFEKNKSVPYMNYNQADWVMSSTDFPTDNDNPNYWLIIDTHTEENSGFACHTATVTSFNPQPSVNVAAGQVSTVELTDAMYDVDNPLAAANGNGTVYFKNVNKVSGTANITATSNVDVTASGFTRTYSIYLNDALAGTIQESTGLTGIVLDYMPLSTANGVAVRAEYKDNTTGLTFHSRTGTGTLESSTEFAAPGTVSLTGKYVAESYDEASGLLNFGVYVEGLDVHYTTEYSGYSDFEFDGCSWTELLHSKSDIYIKAGGLLATSDWTYDGDEDWSSYLRKEMTTSPAPVFLHEATQAQDINSLSAKTYTGKIYAVYPFIYNPGATLSVEESASSAPARVEGLDESTDGSTDGSTNGSTNGSVDYTGFKISNFKVPTEVSVYVPATGAISGIGNVAIDAEACAAEYYTVSGIRVTGDPAPGIYIRRQGGKAEKVVIR